MRKTNGNRNRRSQQREGLLASIGFGSTGREARWHDIQFRGIREIGARKFKSQGPVVRRLSIVVPDIVTLD